MQSAALAIEQLRVMLVDDDEIVREALREMLSRRGWNVTDFSTAEGALDALRREHFDVILTDINMPGLSGIEFLHEARIIASNVPVIMITGYPSIDLAVEAIKYGAVDFLAKPFKADELDMTVRKAAESARAVQRPGDKTRAIGTLPDLARRRLEEKIKELSILHTISESLDESAEKEEIFRKTMDIAQIIADCERAFILVVEQESKELAVRAASGYDDNRSVLGLKFRPDSEPFNGVLRNRSFILFQAENGSLGELVPFRLKGEKTAVLLAPLVINREVVVILGLAGRPGGKELTNETLTLLINLTAKASLKLENIALSENIFSSIIGALNSLLNALDARDTYTKDHSHRVTRYAVQIAKSMGCSQDVIDSISFAGPLHDIGKIGVRDEILLKQSNFTDEERAIMKSHVVRGEEILRPLNLHVSEKAVVLYHHERWDGCGYPMGLSGQDIPLVARIFSVADTFDAMTSTRPYRSALAMETAREEILRCRGSQFDPEVVDAFLASEILKG